MDLVARAKNIILSPAREWEVIKTEPISTGEIYTKYVMILTAIPSVAGFIGSSVVGRSIMGQPYKSPLLVGLVWAVFGYVLTLACVYLLGAIIDRLAPTFGCMRNKNASHKIAAFSTTASLLAGIFSMIPAISSLAVLGLYSLYLLYGGMRSLKEIPSEQMVTYYVVTLIVSLVVDFALAFVIGVPLYTALRP
jgi:hypothetical protein